jgi:hypothetical protein
LLATFLGGILGVAGVDWAGAAEGDGNAVSAPPQSGEALPDLPSGAAAEPAPWYLQWMPQSFFSPGAAFNPEATPLPAPPPRKLDPEVQRRIDNEKNWLQMELDRQQSLQQQAQSQLETLMQELRTGRKEGSEELREEAGLLPGGSTFGLVKEQASKSAAQQQRSEAVARYSSALGTGLLRNEGKPSIFSSRFGKDKDEPEKEPFGSGPKPADDFKAQPSEFGIEIPMSMGSEAWRNDHGLPSEATASTSSYKGVVQTGNNIGSLLDMQGRDVDYLSADYMMSVVGNSRFKEPEDLVPDNGLLDDPWAEALVKLQPPKPPTPMDKFPGFAKAEAITRKAEMFVPQAPPVPAGPTLRDIQLERLLNRSVVRDPVQAFGRNSRR